MYFQVVSDYASAGDRLAPRDRPALVSLSKRPSHDGSDSTAVTPSLDLHTAVRRQSWTWLEAIVRRLALSIELVDERGALCPPLVATSPTPALRKLLNGGSSSMLRDALSTAMRTREREQLLVEGLDVQVLPLTGGTAAAGALVLARSQPALASPASDPEIDAAGSWLARAIEAQLDVPLDDADAFDRVSSLHRLLHEAVDRGVERDILVAFTEALIAWDTLEVRAYVEDVHGQFTLSVATPGSDRLQPSTFADRSLVAELTGPVRLSPVEAARHGFPPERDVMLVRVGTEHSQPWLILVSGTFTPRDEARLSLYLDLLREAVARAATIAETRTSWAILQQLLGGGESVEQTAEAALAELSRAVDALGSALVVTALNGVQVLTIGDGTAFSASNTGLEFDQLVSTQPVLDAHTMVLAVRRARGHAFTRREQQLVDRAAATLAAWLPGVLRAPGHGYERRTEGGDFNCLLDRVAAQNVADGLDVVLLVVLAPGAVSRPGLLHKWVAEIRGQLRASDLAGALSDREIGVLLSGTTTGDLAAVRARILRYVTMPDSLGAATPVSIGVASHSAGTSIEGSLVGAARHHAARRVPGGEWP